MLCQKWHSIFLHIMKAVLTTLIVANSFHSINAWNFMLEILLKIKTKCLYSQIGRSLILSFK